MTQEEYVKKWRTKWLGYILDFAIADLRGGLLYARLKEAEREMTNDLNLMYRDAKEQPLNVTPKPLPPKGGTQTPNGKAG